MCFNNHKKIEKLLYSIIFNPQFLLNLLKFYNVLLFNLDDTSSNLFSE
jgi:hypothetical protein